MNEIAEKPKKSMMMAQRDYVTSIGEGLKSIIGNMDNYQAICGYNILSRINILLSKEGLSHLSEGIDRESINNAIKYVVYYRLNCDNNEVYCMIRNDKRKRFRVDNNGNKKEEEYWVKVIEVKPQYKGTLKIVAKYGRNVEKVYPEWIVREGDVFKYPIYKGVDGANPPEWEIHGTDGNVKLVVVPILFKDGYIDYRIAERESVATNIKAQIKQSLIGKPQAQKEEIMAKIRDMTLEELLTDKTVKNFVNETYTGLSSEEMIITKLVLNAVKRVPIDYDSALARELNEKTFDNSDVYVKNHNAEEVLAMANAPMIEGKEIESKEETHEVADYGKVVEGEDASSLFEDDGVVEQ